MNIPFRKVAFAIIFFSLFISLKAGFFDDFDMSKLMNSVIDSALGQKPKVNDVILAKGISNGRWPVSPTNKFDPGDQKIYVFLEILNFRDEQNALSAEWSYRNKNEWTNSRSFKINPSEGATNVYFYISMDDGASWPVGEYKVDIYVCGEHSITKFFNVEDSSRQTEKNVNPASQFKSKIFKTVAEGSEQSDFPAILLPKK